MKSMFKPTVMAGALALLCLTSTRGLAQGGPPQGGGRNFDPAQMQQRMMDRYKETLEFTNEDEWKAVQPMIQKVVEARRETSTGGMGRGMFGRGQRGGANAPQADQAQGNENRPRGFGAEPSQAVQELEKALEAKAPADEIKAKLAKVRDERKAKEAALTKAQEDLRKVLNARREAQAVVSGLLN